MNQITTYHTSEGLHTLWYSQGQYKLENHTTGTIAAIAKDEALTIIHRYGYRNKRIYAPTLSERWERPKAMQEIETGVFSWSEA